MEDGELNTTEVIILQNRRNGKPTESKHARQHAEAGKGCRSANSKEWTLGCYKCIFNMSILFFLCLIFLSKLLRICHQWLQEIIKHPMFVWKSCLTYQVNCYIWQSSIPFTTQKSLHLLCVTGILGIFSKLNQSTKLCWITTSWFKLL